MASNENMCSDKEALIVYDDVTHGNTDEVAKQTPQEVEENAEQNFDRNLNEELKRIRKPTEKGKEQWVNSLKQKRTTSLLAVTRKRNDIKRLMSDRNNLDVVKTELTQLDILCQQFVDEHHNYLDQLESAEDKERACQHFAEKENDIFEYRKEVANWITASKERFRDGLSEIDDKRSEMSRRSNKSRASLKSHSSNLSRLSRTSSLARAEERAKVAELLAEKAMLQKKVQLEAAEKEFELDLKIAKAQAREKAFTEIENEKRKIIDDDISDYLHLPDTKSTSKDRKPPTDLRDKTENPTHLTPPLDSTPKLNRNPNLK